MSMAHSLGVPVQVHACTCTCTHATEINGFPLVSGFKLFV